MNRLQRRALKRAEQRPLADDLVSVVKNTHKLPTQVCALWVPVAQGYVRHFSTHGFGVIELASLARHYLEDEASSAAAAFRKITGLRVVVRPVHRSQGDL